MSRHPAYSLRWLYDELGNDPRMWPARVYDFLEPAFVALQLRKGLREEDTTNLARFFIFPNVFRWCLTLADAQRVPSYAEQCPIYNSNQDCAVAQLLSSRSDAPLCTAGRGEHPWRLHLELLWNSGRNVKNYLAHQGAHPEPDCALEVYRRVVINEESQNRWNYVKLSQKGNSRPTRVEEQWSVLTKALKSALAEAQVNEFDLNDSDARFRAVASLAEGLTKVRYEPFAGLCRQVHSVVDGWTRMQRQKYLASVQAEALGEEEFNDAVTPLLTQLNTAWNAGFDFVPGQQGEVVNPFLELLRNHELSANEVRLKLTSQTVRCDEIPTLKKRINELVVNFESSGFPAGDPLDDPVVADHVWDWVGGSARPDTGHPFDRWKWCNAWWSVPENQERPQWMIYR